MRAARSASRYRTGCDWAVTLAADRLRRESRSSCHTTTAAAARDEYLVVLSTMLQADGSGVSIRVSPLDDSVEAARAGTKHREGRKCPPIPSMRPSCELV